MTRSSTITFPGMPSCRVRHIVVVLSPSDGFLLRTATPPRSKGGILMTRPPVSTDQAMGEREARPTTGPGKGRLVENSLLRASLVTADLFGGVAEAVGQGFRSFRSELTADNITKVDVSNGWLAGMVAANVRFFEEMAKNARRFQEDLLRGQEEGVTQR